MGRTVRLLFAEDDPDDRVLTEDAIAASRIRTELHFVEDGEQLMDYLRRRGPYRDAPVPTLVLLDLNMPRKDGREALAEIKSDKELRKIPVVVLTTSSAREDVVACYDSGANSYVIKPMSFEGLVEVMRQLARYWLETAKLPADGT